MSYKITTVEGIGETYAARLQREQGWTPMFLRYNSGRHISENGEDFAVVLENPKYMRAVNTGGTALIVITGAR